MLCCLKIDLQFVNIFCGNQVAILRSVDQLYDDYYITLLNNSGERGLRILSWRAACWPALPK
jgi:hypothetical protein